MAVSSEDIKLKVVIDSGNADLSGITRAGEELSSVGKSGEAAIDRISAAVNNLNSKGASIASAGDGLKNITSNASATESSLNSLGKELAQVHSQFASLRSGSEAFDALKAKSADLQAQIQQLKGTTNQIVSPSTITNTKALNSSLVDISRVISDMPYGMQGIANNLQQLPGSFGRLRAEADATGQSMTSMLVQGVMSPMGAGIAVAAITAMWVAWDMYGAKAISAMDGAGKSAKELEQRLDGVSKYENIGITVAMHGAEGAKRDLLNLINLQERLGMLTLENKLESNLTKAKNMPNLSHQYGTTGQYFGGGIGGDANMQGAQANVKDLAIAKAELDIRNHTLEVNQSIWKGEMTFGYEENKRRLTTANVDEKAVVNRLKLLAVQGQVNDAAAKSAASADKEAEKLANKLDKAKAASKTVTGSNSELNALITSWNSAFKAADTALGRMDMKDTITSIAEAKSATEGYRAEMERLQKTGDPKNIEALTKATQGYTTSLGITTHLQGEYNAATKEGYQLSIQASKLLGTYTESALSLEDAILGVNVAQMEYNHWLTLNNAPGSKDQFSQEVIDSEKRLKDEIARGNQAKAAQKELGQQWSETASLVNDAWQSITGSSFAGISSIETGLKTMADSSREVIKGVSNELIGALQLAKGLGKSIGGGFGNAVSSGASGAIGGASLFSALGIGGPWGMVAGGVLGLASSLFDGGASAQAVQTAQQTASSQASMIASLAASGLMIAQQIMAKEGYSTTTLSTSAKMSDLSGMGLDKYMGTNTRDFGLLYTAENRYNASLVTYLQNLAQVDKSLKSMTDPAIVETINQINYKWDALIATMGASTDIEQARMNDLIVSITGISANTVGADIVASFNSYTGFADAGTAAATKIKDETVSAIQQMTISNLLIQPVMDMIQPMLETVVTKMKSGIALTADDLTGLRSVYDSALSSVTPLVNSTFDLFKATGVLTSAQQEATKTTTTLSGSTTTLSGATTTLAGATTTLADSITSISYATTAAEASVGRFSLQMSLMHGTLKTAEQTAQEAYSIESELMTALGDTAGLRQRELATLSPLNQSLKQMVYNLADAQAAAAQTASAVTTAQSEFDQASAQLEQARAALNSGAVSSPVVSTSSSAPTSTEFAQTALSNAQTALSDAKTAVADALSAFKTQIDSQKQVVTDSLTALKTTIDYQKTAVTGVYNAQLKAANAQLTAAQANVSTVQGINDQLHSALSGFATSTDSAYSRTGAQSTLASMLIAAQSGGMPDSSKLSTVLSILSKSSTSQFRSAIDYQRDYYKTVSQITALSALSDHQLTDAQQQIVRLDTQIEVLKRIYDIQTRSLDAIFGVNDSVTAAKTAQFQTATDAYTLQRDARDTSYKSAVAQMSTTTGVSLNQIAAIKGVSIDQVAVMLGLADVQKGLSLNQIAAVKGSSVDTITSSLKLSDAQTILLRQQISATGSLDGTLTESQATQLRTLTDSYNIQTAAADTAYNTTIDQINATTGVSAAVTAASTAQLKYQRDAADAQIASLDELYQSSAKQVTALDSVTTSALSLSAALSLYTSTQAALAQAVDSAARAITVTDAISSSGSGSGSSTGAGSDLQGTYDRALINYTNSLGRLTTAIENNNNAQNNLTTTKDSATTALTAQQKTDKDTANYITAKVAQLNAIDYQQKSNWTSADVSAAFASAGLTAQQHSESYAATEGLPAYGTAGVYQQDLVQKMFSVFLGRAATEGDDLYYKNRVAQVGTSQVVAEIVGSAEYAAKNSTIESLYQNLFMRAADPSSLAYWRASGLPMAQIQTEFLSSPEYAGIKAVRGFASGGYHDGGWMMVGEQGRELVNTGTSPARIFNNRQTENLIDISALVASNNKISKAIEGLREEMKVGDAAIALNTSKMVKILRQEFQSGGSLV